MIGRLFHLEYLMQDVETDLIVPPCLSLKKILKAFRLRLISMYCLLKSSKRDQVKIPLAIIYVRLGVNMSKIP